MSEKYQMFFETYLEDTQFNHKGETVSVHPKTLQHQKESMMGRTVTPSKMTQKDTVCITGLKNEQGEFVVESISRSGSSVTALAQELYPQDGSESLTPKDEKEAAFEAYTSPQSVEIEGMEFSVDGPLAGKIVDLERASSDGAHDLFEAAEKNMELSLHMNHNIGDAVREQRDAASRAEVENLSQTQTFYLGIDAETGKKFASREEPSPESAPHMTSIQMGKVNDKAVIIGFEVHDRVNGKTFAFSGKDQEETVSLGVLDLKVGEPLLVNDKKLDALSGAAKNNANAFLNEVNQAQHEITGEKIRTRAVHRNDLELAPQRMAAHEARMEIGMDAR